MTASSERAALSGYLVASESPAVDKQFKIPSAQVLFGTAGPAAIARLDRELEALVSASKAAASRAAWASSSSFGAGPTVTVRSLPYTAPPPPGEVVDFMSLQGQGRNGSASFKETVQLNTQADECPAQRDFFGVSKAHGVYTATIAIQQPLPDGHVHVVLVKIHTTDRWDAYVYSDAAIHAIRQGPYEFDAGNALVLEYDNYVHDPNGNRSNEESGSFALGYGLNDWNIDYYGTEYPARPPDPAAQALMEHFMSMVAVSLHRAFDRAEQYWRTPGNCVVLALQPAQTFLKPGQQVEVSAFLHRPGDMTTLKTHGKFTTEVSPAGAKVVPMGGSFGRGNSLVRFEFTAPDSPRDTEAILDVDMTSDLGIAKANQPFTIGGSPPYGGTFSGRDDLDGLNWTWSGTVHYDTPAYSGLGYSPTSGSVSWQLSGTDVYGCKYSGSGSFSIVNGKVAGYPVGGAEEVYPNGTYDLDLNTNAEAQLGPIVGYNEWPVTVACPGISAYTADLFQADWLTYDISGAPYYHLVGDRMVGSFTAGPESWKWDLRPESKAS